MAEITKVDINSATHGELTQIAGIGDDLADKIIHYRKSHRGFRELEELDKFQIEKDKLKKIKQHVFVGERFKEPYFGSR